MSDMEGQRPEQDSEHDGLFFIVAEMEGGEMGLVKLDPAPSNPDARRELARRSSRMACLFNDFRDAAARWGQETGRLLFQNRIVHSLGKRLRRACFPPRRRPWAKKRKRI